ncbi:unnamed protein product [Schistocephalus solidus]|uniref:DUF3077 domain-containing protein n=1 Tax=Schistocephalus solidus TaxID=70667 RepID=A0A183TAQ7_SCHSO|nr:unnamed protein product [Schistocephalus solidus]
MHTTTMPLARGSATAASKFAGAANAARLVQVVLKAANLAYLGATLKSPESEEGDGRDADLQLFTATGTILLRFAGRTASGQQDCLVELRLPVDEEQASDPPTVMPARTGSSLPCPGLRVHTEAMSLGLQLAKELVDHALTGV